MSRPLSDTELLHLFSFIGYGRLDAPVWFLGMEEAGGGEENIRARLQFQPVEDLALAHRILRITKHHEGKRVIQRTWRGMCYIMLRLAGQATDAESIRTYQAECLGRSNGETLLIELMPIPKPEIGAWGYEELIPQCPSRETYYDTVKPHRINALKQIIAQKRPKVVIAYGKSYWCDYELLFPHAHWHHVGQFCVDKEEGTCVVLTDHLTARTMNGKLDEVVAIIQQTRVG